MVVYACDPSYAESIGRSLRLDPDKNVRPCLKKKKKVKMAGDKVQKMAWGPFPSKRKALSSNPSTAMNK
jgi:hypothetical protein